MYKDEGSDARKVYNHGSLKPLLRFHHFNQLNVDLLLLKTPNLFHLYIQFFTID